MDYFLHGAVMSSVMMAWFESQGGEFEDHRFEAFLAAVILLLWPLVLFVALYVLCEKVLIVRT